MYLNSLLALLPTFGVLYVAGHALEVRQGGPYHDMIFDCTNNLEQICTNMCFAYNCAGKPLSLTWDKPSAKVERARRTKAGCKKTGGNRCTKKPYGSAYQCDEYPFASVSQADAGGQINRCVLATQNNAQSTVIRTFYNSQGSFKGEGCDGNAPCNFNVLFANAGTTKYCGTKPDCKNDGNEYTKNGEYSKKKRDVAATSQTATRFLLSSGVEVYAPLGANIGDVTWSAVPINTTLWEEQINAHEYDEEQDQSQYDYMVENMKLESYEIVAEVPDSAE